MIREKKLVPDGTAKYVGGQPKEIALTDSTTEGLALIYNGLILKPGDEILCTTHDHYVHHEAQRMAAARTGATVRRVPLFDRIEDLPRITEESIVERLRRAIGPSTRVLGITWVHSQTGLKLPIAAIAAAVREMNASREPGARVLVVVELVDVGFVQAQVDGLAVERGFRRLGEQRAQQVLRAGHRLLAAADPEQVAAVGDFHAQAQFDLAQVAVEGAGQVGQAFGIGRFEGEIAVGGSGHGARDPRDCRHGEQRVARLPAAGQPQDAITCA